MDLGGERGYFRRMWGWMGQLCSWGWLHTSFILFHLKKILNQDPICKSFKSLNSLIGFHVGSNAGAVWTEGGDGFGRKRC